jgi:cytochrome c556
MIRSLLFTLGLYALISILVSTQPFAQEDVVAKRKAFMRENYDAWKAIKRAVEQKDYRTIELKAKDIMGYMDQTLDYFPKGSISEKSRAKAEIWDKWDEFSKTPIKVKDVANALAQAAVAKDEAKVQVQSNALIGPVGSPYRGGACYECHKSYYNTPPPIKKADG